ncbi:uncharacterized protein RHO25_011872 [Cercospora beticola]|uniref:Uncharacterized protein n=1 Tax=Cercospora beticola TaxID=122368 RepID=A0ABZ0P5Y2_CERBT|nr:hypothetical protein RHO25_011872 [Cercospora beticola]
MDGIGHRRTERRARSQCSAIPKQLQESTSFSEEGGTSPLLNVAKRYGSAVKGRLRLATTYFFRINPRGKARSPLAPAGGAKERRCITASAGRNDEAQSHPGKSKVFPLESTDALPLLVVDSIEKPPKLCDFLDCTDPALCLFHPEYHLFVLGLSEIASGCAPRIKSVLTGVVDIEVAWIVVTGVSNKAVATSVEADITSMVFSGSVCIRSADNQFVSRIRHSITDTSIDLRLSGSRQIGVVQEQVGGHSSGRARGWVASYGVAN